MAACLNCGLDPCGSPSACGAALAAPVGAPAAGTPATPRANRLKALWISRPRLTSLVLGIAGTLAANGVWALMSNSNYGASGSANYEIRNVRIGDKRGQGNYILGETVPQQVVDTDKKGRITKVENFTTSFDPVTRKTTYIPGDSIKINYGIENEIVSAEIEGGSE